MIGKIFSTEEFSVYDGPGIRTTVFLKGCPLRCSWCHNPEGQNPSSEIVRSPNGCTHCNRCIKHACVVDGNTFYTEESIKNCPANLLRTCGEDISSTELCEKLMKNAPILSNGGGITFSGGEPFYQSDFLNECLLLLKGKLHTAVQTSGFTSEDIFLKTLEIADYFLFDIKLADNKEHIKYTGVPNTRILRNFSSLAKSEKAFTVRIPLIPGVTDTEHNINAISSILIENDVKYAELLPYNKMAGGKYKMTGRKYSPDFDETQPPQSHKEIFSDYGIAIKIL